MTLTGLQYGVFKYKQAYIRSDIKRAIKEGVPEDELVDFRFYVQDEAWINLDWTKPEKEFRFNDQMYDIIETRKSNDTIYFKCIHDVKESGLFQKIDQMTNSRSSKEKSVVVYWSKQVYSLKNGIINHIDPFDDIVKEQEEPIYKESKFQMFKKTPNPPPPKV